MTDQPFNTPTSLGNARWGMPADYSTAAPSPAFASEGIAQAAYARRFPRTVNRHNVMSRQYASEKKWYSFLTEKVMITDTFGVPVWALIVAGGVILWAVIKFWPQARRTLGFSSTAYGNTARW